MEIKLDTRLQKLICSRKHMENFVNELKDELKNLKLRDFLKIIL